MNVLGLKRIWRRWVAAILVVVLTTMTPFQSIAGQLNRFQTGNEVEGHEIALTDDRAISGYRQMGTPSDAELEEDTDLEQSTPSNPNLLKAEKSYVVKFYVDSELWDTQDVTAGGCAGEPAPPEKDGYTFTGWESDYTNVVRNISIKARFVKGTYQTHRVVFADDDGRWLMNAQYVIHGQNAGRPPSPKRDGYTFVGWDNQRFCIKTDTVITAQYQEGIQDTFYFEYGGLCVDNASSNHIIKEEWVVKGGDGSPPVPEKVPGYTFKEWPNPERYINVQNGAYVWATYYTGDINTYEVEFVDYDGRALYAPQQVAYGLDATRPPSPKREGYTFVGWDKQRFCIKSDTVITAQYREGTLDIAYLEYYGRCPDKSSSSVLLKEEWVVKGEDGSPPIPEKVPGYTFREWPNPEKYLNVQKGDKLFAWYYAGEIKTYKVEFVDYDGRALYAPQQITYGRDAARPPSPKREGYTFVGWDKQRFCIKSDTVITAQYREGTLNIAFLQYNGRCPDKALSNVLLKEEWVVKGENGTPPVLEEVPGYTFKEWPNPERYINVQKNNIIYANYYAGEIKTSKVEFVDYDGRVLYAPQQIAYGRDAARPPSPKREGYTFVGWDKQRFCIKSDTVITAQYREGTLDIAFLQYNGRCPDKALSNVLLKEEWVVKGEDGSPSVPEEVPGYTFKEWLYPEKYLNVQKGDTIYANYYAGEIKTSKVKFVDYDGRVLYAPQQIAYGRDANRPPSPKREGYTFVGWDKQRFCIKSDTVITAQYREGTLDIAFLQYTGRCSDKALGNVLLKEEWVVKGEDGSPPVPEEVPGYTFNGWPNPGKYINVQKGDTIYANYYAGEIKTYKVEFVDYDGHRLYYPQYIAEGKLPTYPNPPKREGYTFTGWDKRLPPATNSVRVQAEYIPGIYKTNKVTFYGRITGGSSWVILKEELVPVGQDATPPVPPVYAGYVFTGWPDSYKNIQSSRHIYATYKSEDSVTGENKLKIYKSLLSKLNLSDELEEALIELGTILATGEEEEAATRVAPGLALAVLAKEIAVLIVAAVGAYLARPLFEAIAESITISFGRTADSAVDAIEDALDDTLAEGDGDAEEDSGSNNMGDPNKNPDPTIMAGIIAKISDSLKDKVGTCDGFAKALAEKLNQAGISFEIIRIDSKAGYIYSDKYGDFIGKTYHYGIRIGNMVYDNLTLTGMRCEEWLADLGASGEFADIVWKIVKEIINH